MATIHISPNNATRLNIHWYRVRNMLIFIAVVLVCIGIGQLASQLLPSRYQALAVVSQPHQGLLDDLNAPADLLYAYSDILPNIQLFDNMLRISVSDVFARFIMIFHSSDTIKSFYIEKNMYSLYGFENVDASLAFLRSIDDFVHSFSSEQIQYGVISALVMHHTNSRAETASEILNVYLQFVADKTLENIVIEQNDKKQVVLQRLEEYIQLLHTNPKGVASDTSDNQQVLNHVIPADTATITSLTKTLASYKVQGNAFRPIQVVSYANAELAKRSPALHQILLLSFVVGCLVGIALLLLLSWRATSD